MVKYPQWYSKYKRDPPLIKLKEEYEKIQAKNYLIKKSNKL